MDKSEWMHGLNKRARACIAHLPGVNSRDDLIEWLRQNGIDALLKEVGVWRGTSSAILEWLAIDFSGFATVSTIYESHELRNKLSKAAVFLEAHGYKVTPRVEADNSAH